MYVHIRKDSRHVFSRNRRPPTKMKRKDYDLAIVSFADRCKNRSRTLFSCRIMSVWRESKYLFVGENPDQQSLSSEGTRRWMQWRSFRSEERKRVTLRIINSRWLINPREKALSVAKGELILCHIKRRN